jgi:S-disulfanyl-L-cysteine oxidoreductase SoxD
MTLLMRPLYSQASPNLGVTPSQDLIDAWDISIGPRGNGLPTGFGDASKGEPVFLAKCAICHGVDGEGLINDSLVGGFGSLTETRPLKTVGSYWPFATTLYDYIRRAMPYNNPHSLSNEESYSLTAFILFMNGIIAKDEELNQNNLALIEMPNQKNFYSPSYELP